MDRLPPHTHTHTHTHVSLQPPATERESVRSYVRDKVRGRDTGGKRGGGGGRDSDGRMGADWTATSVCVRVRACAWVCLGAGSLEQACVSSIDMYNNDGGEKFMKQTGALKAATLYFAS